MRTSFPAWLALCAIRFYQRYLSPRKGYCCALHALGGGRSCSAYGYQAIARGGVLHGLILLLRRVDTCARLNARRRVAHLAPGLARQQGFCDGLDCGGCDGAEGCAHAGDLFDCASNCSPGDCTWTRHRPVRPDVNLDDPINNENALQQRVRKAQALQINKAADNPDDAPR